jgi:hypothetical protein
MINLRAWYKISNEAALYLRRDAILKEKIQSRYSKEELDFFKRYPYIFAQVNSRVSLSCMPWGLHIENGWLPILDKLCKQITFLYKIGINTEFTQVKEKLAEMRVYHTSYRVRFLKLHQWLRRYFYIPLNNKIFVGPDVKTPSFHKFLNSVYLKVEKFENKINRISGSSMSDDIIHALVLDALRESSQTCEMCGELGWTRTSGRWLKTLCDVHTKELNYKEMPK